MFMTAARALTKILCGHKSLQVVSSKGISDDHQDFHQIHLPIPLSLLYLASHSIFSNSRD